MLKFIKGLIEGMKKFFSGIFKKKARPADVGGQAKPPEQK